MFMFCLLKKIYVVEPLFFYIWNLTCAPKFNSFGVSAKTHTSWW